MENSLQMYVIYEHPSDYPNSYVLRLFRDGTPTPLHVVADSLEGVRQFIPAGLVRIPREGADDPVIVESWI